MTHEEHNKETVSAGVLPQTQKTPIATIGDLLDAIQEGFSHIEGALHELELFELRLVTEGQTDALDELEHYLLDLYFKIIAAFELLKLAESLMEIRSRWEGCRKNLRDYSLKHHGDEPYIYCHAVTVIRMAASTLEVAVLREQIQERREDQKATEQRNSESAQREEQHGHERMTREEQHAHERRTLKTTTTMGVVTVLLSLLFGNCQNIAGLFKGEESSVRSSLVLSGTISAPEASDERLVKVVCEPAVEGVVTAAGGGRYTMAVLPHVPLPLDLFCRGEAPGLQSESVFVSIPARSPPRGRPPFGTFAPTITLKPTSVARVENQESGDSPALR